MSARKKPVEQPEIKDHYAYEMILYSEDIEDMIAKLLAERGMIICDSELEVDEHNNVIMRCYGKLSRNLMAPEQPAVEQQQQEV